MAFHCYYEYTFDDAPEEHANMGPCGQGDNPDNIQCCGISETCMSNGICAYSSANAGGSGYYIGGCTDKTFKDPRCPRNCTDFDNSDVVYDYDVGQWRCCGIDDQGNRNCSFPEGDVMNEGAPAPMDLLYIATIVATGSSLPLASKVPVLSSSDGSLVTPTDGAATATVTVSSDDDSGSDGLSPGASAGIAVAAVLAVVAAVAVGLWILSRRRKHRLQQTYTPVTTMQPPIAAQEKSAFDHQIYPTTTPPPMLSPPRLQSPPLPESPGVVPQELSTETERRK